jgi:signal transduction histidine kinase
VKAELRSAHQPPDLSSLCLAITEHAPFPMATVEGVSQIVHSVNPAFCRLMDKPTEQLVGKSFYELLPEKNGCVEMLDRVFRTGKPESHTETEHPKPHPAFWSYTMWPVMADERPVGVMIQVTETAQVHEKMLAMNEALTLAALRQHELTEAAENLNEQLRAEIDERKRVEEALRKSETQVRALFESAEAARLSAEAAKARAEAATRAKDDFLAALSHELRTPLSPALLLATSLADDAVLPPRVREDIDVIAKAIALQAQLIDDMLDITRITTGKLRLDLQPVDAHLALRHAYEILRADVQERQIEVTLDLVAPHNCINADAVRVQQIFWNVLKNAVKFTPPGGAITVRTRNPADKEGTLMVEITDTGIGIEPEMLGKVFDTFIQEEHDRAHRFGGIGLGLAITRRLVELQEGKISAESSGRNRGATFRIELPLEVTELCAAAESVSPPPAAVSPATRRILLVEDHEQTRATLVQLLERHGHTVAGVSNATAAREIVAASKFDVVISDLGLPDSDGHALMVELRDAYGLPGIALSGYGTNEDLERSRKSGFFTHLTKPVDIHALEATIAMAPRSAGS